MTRLQDPQHAELEPRSKGTSAEEAVWQWIDGMRDDRETLNDIYSEFMGDPDFVRNIVAAALEGDVLDNTAYPLSTLSSQLVNRYQDVAFEWLEQKLADEEWD